MAIQQSILRPERYGQSLSISQYAQRSIHPIRIYALQDVIRRVGSTPIGSLTL